MKRLLTVFVVFVGLFAVAGAQNKPVYDREGRVFISAQGGVAASIFDNAWSYYDFAKITDLFGGQGSVSLGYDFNTMWAVRLNVGYAKDHAAYNIKQTAGGFFRPYDFNSVSGFVDVILDLNGIKGNIRRFSPKLYGGLGVGYSYKFEDQFDGPVHPWQITTDPNVAFAGRFGFIGEYCFANGFGLYVDLAGEGYLDNFSGLCPKDGEITKNGHYSGFPFDVRGLVSFGVVLHL